MYPGACRWQEARPSAKEWLSETNAGCVTTKGRAGSWIWNWRRARGVAGSWAEHARNEERSSHCLGVRTDHLPATGAWLQPDRQFSPRSDRLRLLIGSSARWTADPDRSRHRKSASTAPRPPFSGPVRTGQPGRPSATRRRRRRSRRSMTTCCRRLCDELPGPRGPRTGRQARSPCKMAHRGFGSGHDTAPSSRRSVTSSAPRFPEVRRSATPPRSTSRLRSIAGD